MADGLVAKSGTDAPVVQSGSFQAVQDAIFALSRRTERLAGMHYDAFQIRFEDLVNLDQRIRQVAESVHGQCGDTVISVNYSDNRVERHSGIDRFSMHGTVRNCVVESIDVELEVAVKTKDGAEPRLYSITVGVRSIVGVTAQMNHRKASEVERRIVRDFDQATGRYMVQYVDYMVARSFETCIEDWFKSLRIARDNALIARIRESSGLLATASAITGLGVVSALIYVMFADRVQSVRDLLPIGLIATFSLVVSDRLTRSFAKRFIDWLKSTAPVSFISISQADNDALDLQKPKGYLAAKITVLWLLSLPGVVLASWLADYFFPFAQ